MESPRPHPDPELWFLTAFCTYLGSPGAKESPLRGVYTAGGGHHAPGAAPEAGPAGDGGPLVLPPGDMGRG